MKKVVEEILKMQKERDWKQFHTPSNLAKSISIEAGELLECFQWDDVNYDKNQVKEELCDVINYCLLMANTLEIDLECEMLNKIEKNKNKYPVEKSKGKNLKYTKL